MGRDIPGSMLSRSGNADILACIITGMLLLSLHNLAESVLRGQGISLTAPEAMVQQLASECHCSLILLQTKMGRPKSHCLRNLN
jgi:hypothetical protein